MAQTHLPHDHGQDTEKIFRAMPGEAEFQTAADTFRQLGDPTRLRIFWLLCHCEECVLNLSALMNMSSPAVSHHLKQLKACGLITGLRAGKEVYYKAAGTKQCSELLHMVEKLMQLEDTD
ncbi:MAG TPA: winged helix-turn-helix transcriptional regulator [Candidatus Choladousia intestinipullorum]|nr:winged helix-turn-helix transcriptional regulator [Candidatus Choladousia intestinipullorum]